MGDDTVTGDVTHAHARLLPLVPGSEPSDWYRAHVVRRARDGSPPLPRHRPMTTAELDAAGVTRAQRRDHYLRVDVGVYVPLTALDTGSVSRQTPAATLVRAHHLRYPAHLATGFAAGAVLGMCYLVDDAPLEFLVTRGAGCANPAPHLLLTRTRRHDRLIRTADHPDPAFPTLACTTAGHTLGTMIRMLHSPSPALDAAWRVPDLQHIQPQLSPAFIRSVQASDCLHQALRSTRPGSVTNLVRTGTVDAPTAAAVLGATDPGAESSPETVLRLAVSDLAPGLRSQVPVWRDNGSLLTAADLGWPGRGVHLFYDGEHHLRRTQRDHDSEVLARLQQDGGRVLRVTAGNLRDADSVEALRGRVRDALG
ncbi:hypothetical protein [Corynebacterium kalidii]|uniref:DUF559 domain-containing protein n=1 Tax=Corynebacterium kalidii TaxID=2931982 RepID=A0A9X2B1E4_9CORY|nr:hypothetical protein [Corynebacterium kalidii]MCJ7857924.1 hypothetical protein [Corynebacterium kalidii]